MKVRFLEPVQNGERKFAPGDVAYIADREAHALIAVKAAEAVATIQGNTPIRISITLPDTRGAQ